MTTATRGSGKRAAAPPQAQEQQPEQVQEPERKYPSPQERAEAQAKQTQEQDRASRAALRNDDPYLLDSITITRPRKRSDPDDEGESRTYTFEELTMLRTSEVGELIAENLNALVAEGILTQETWDKLDPSNLIQLADLLRKVWVKIPDLIRKLLGLILSAEDEADEAFIFSWLKVTQLPHVLDGFFAANEVADIADSFFRSGQKVLGAVRAAREPRPT
jgi:hypothetical protein